MPREGVRDAGCLMHPQPHAQKRVARPRTSIHSGGTGKPGNPARNGVTAYTVLSSGRCSLRPSSRGLRFCPARLGGLASAGLDPSIRGGTTRLRSPLQYRSSCAIFISSQAQLNGRPPCQLDHARYRRVHRISSRVRDDRDTPLVWDETILVVDCFEQKVNRNIFGEGAGQLPKQIKSCRLGTDIAGGGRM